MKWFLTLFFVIWMIPAEVPAGIAVEKNDKYETTWKKFNEAVADKVAEIKGFAFGPIIKVLGMLGIAYGMAMLAWGQTRPIMLWGGIGLMLNIIPSFIDTIFGALLP